MERKLLCNLLSRTQQQSTGRAPDHLFGSMPDVVEHTDVVCPPKRTLAEQAEKGRILPPVDFFRSSEARLRNPPVFRQISARPLAKRGVRVVGAPQHL